MVVNKNLKNIGLVFVAGCLLHMQPASATDAPKEHKWASQIAREKGKIIAKDVETWMPDKELPKDWVTLENKYFTLSYPKCMKTEGEDEEDNIKLTSSLAFLSSPNCPELTQKLDNWEIFGVGYEYLMGNRTSIAKIGDTNALKIQNLIINGNPARFLTIATDSNVGNASGTLLQMRQIIYLLCDQKVMSFTYDSPRGDVSVQRIEKSEFDFPANLKKIVSTFECPKKDHHGHK